MKGIKKFLGFDKSLRPFSTSGSQFMAMTGLKFVLLPLVAILISSSIVWLFIEMDNIYFQANLKNQMKELHSAYFDFIIQSVLNALPMMSVFLIFLFFYGSYIAQLMLRPFISINEYCEKRLSGEKCEFTPDRFSDLKLLTRFTDFFFYNIEHAENQKSLKPVLIPKQFLGVHTPVFDKVFFLHFSLLMSIVFLVSAGFVYYIMVEIYSNIVELAVTTLRISNTDTMYFLREQGEIVNVIVYVILTLIFGLYIILAFNMYHQISGAAFGVFATMRSFLKGNYKSRVHLIGFAHIRSYTRTFNKYLDMIVKKFSDQ